MKWGKETESRKVLQMVTGWMDFSPRAGVWPLELRADPGRSLQSLHAPAFWPLGQPC